MSNVVHKPPQQHRCCVGWKVVPLPDDHGARATGATHMYVMDGEWDPPGTIRACEKCGKTWVGFRGGNVLITRWRAEGRFERWRRSRRALKGGGTNG